MTRWSPEQLAEYQNRRISLGAKPEKKPSKYNNKKTEVDGIKFDSKKEAKRWQELQFRLRSGEISDLQRQVKYRLAVNGVHVCDYVADFVYREGLATVTEDVKSDITRKKRDYRIKCKLMFAVHRINIVEV